MSLPGIKEYALPDPAQMLDDPANQVEPRGLMNEHSPEAIAQVGVWRWPAVFKWRELILRMIQNASVIDFGGAAAPLGYDSLIVDYWSEAKTLYDVPGMADVIFTSHTLEHINDVELCLRMIAHKLHIGGFAIVHVPSFTGVQFRPENNPNHLHSFAVEGMHAPHDVIRLDALMRSVGFYLSVVDHVADSLMIVGKRI